MDPTALNLLEVFHHHSTMGSLHDGDVQRLHAFIHHVARQPLSSDQITVETVAYLCTHPVRPWRQVVAQDLGTRVCQGVELLRFDPSAMD